MLIGKKKFTISFNDLLSLLDSIGYYWVFDTRLNRLKILPNDSGFIGCAVFMLLQRFGSNNYFVNCEKGHFYVLVDLDDIV